MIASLLIAAPLVASLVTPVTSATATPTCPTLAVQDDLPDLKDETDLSIRWLRGTQDRESGSYGGGVTATAWTLRALAESPRKYVLEDGFFVRGALDYLLQHAADDGAICDEGASAKERREQTQLSALALFPYVKDAAAGPAYARALRFLGESGLTDIEAGLPTYATEKTPAAKRVRALLAERGRDNSWQGEQGAVEATAGAVVELSSYFSLLKPKSATPQGAKPLPDYGPADIAASLEALQRGARFLIATAEDGKWGGPGQPDAGLTSMAIGALQALPQPRPAAIQKVIDDGLAWIATHRQDDGSIHQGRLANYVTSAAVLALAASGDDRYQDTLLAARAYLIDLQADEGEGYSEGDRYYGGIGYGGDERPDLSNLQMALEALVASGADKDNEAFKRAVVYLERCQNRSESNDVRIVDGEVLIISGDDGGGQYMPGDSKAGYITDADGNKIPRSYGSMTYALLKGFVLAGLDKDDPRVKAAWNWIRRNYTLDVNPGFDTSRDPRAGYQGLYYYFLSLARALAVFGVDEIEDGEGVTHAWKRQLAGRLISMQSRTDGSWVNENAPRWWEGNPILATAYAMQALAETLD